MPGPRMFVAGYGLHVTNHSVKPGGRSRRRSRDGVPEVLRVVRRRWPRELM